MFPIKRIKMSASYRHLLSFRINDSMLYELKFIEEFKGGRKPDLLRNIFVDGLFRYRAEHLGEYASRIDTSTRAIAKDLYLYEQQQLKESREDKNQDLLDSIRAIISNELKFEMEKLKKENDELKQILLNIEGNTKKKKLFS